MKEHHKCYYCQKEIKDNPALCRSGDGSLMFRVHTKCYTKFKAEYYLGCKRNLIKAFVCKCGKKFHENSFTVIYCRSEEEISSNMDQSDVIIYSNLNETNDIFILHHIQCPARTCQCCHKLLDTRENFKINEFKRKQIVNLHKKCLIKRYDDYSKSIIFEQIFPIKNSKLLSFTYTDYNLIFDSFFSTKFYCPKVFYFYSDECKAAIQTFLLCINRYGVRHIFRDLLPKIFGYVINPLNFPTVNGIFRENFNI